MEITRLGGTFQQDIEICISKFSNQCWEMFQFSGSYLRSVTNFYFLWRRRNWQAEKEIKTFRIEYLPVEGKLFNVVNFLLSVLFFCREKIPIMINLMKNTLIGFGWVHLFYYITIVKGQKTESLLFRRLGSIQLIDLKRNSWMSCQARPERLIHKPTGRNKSQRISKGGYWQNY